MKILAIGCSAVMVLLFLAVVGIGTIASKEWRIERSVEIATTPDGVHPAVGDLMRWPRWSSWINDANPEGSWQPGGDPGVGQSLGWVTKGGRSCTLTITRSDPKSGIEYTFDIADFPSSAQGSFTYEVLESGNTRVTWATWGERTDWLGGFFASLMEPMLGKTYEDDLIQLKIKIETSLRR